MDVDVALVVAGLLVGGLVGLTGMGGGALMTPLLVLVFGVNPLTAVSSDLVTSFAMKPVGGAVHARRGTVDYRLVGWLCLGSVPSAFCGVLLLRALGEGESVDDVVKTALGVALLLAATGMVVKKTLSVRDRVRGVLVEDDGGPVRVRRLPTVLVGVVGGVVVGMTSVGSGSLMIVALILLYPALSPARLVGTDLVQAVPLVGAAALGHAFYGEVDAGVTLSLILGGVPGAYLGARASSRAPQGLVRRALVVVLSLTGLQLLGAPGWLMAASAVALLALAVWGWTRLRGLVVRRTRGAMADEGRDPDDDARAPATAPVTAAPDDARPDDARPVPTGPAGGGR